MTSFLKSKEFIIGVVVILVVIIAVFYFVRKNREFSTKIDILAKKFEEQQQVLSKHEEVIGHLVGLSQRQQSILEQLAGPEGTKPEKDGETPPRPRENPRPNRLPPPENRKPISTPPPQKSVTAPVKNKPTPAAVYHEKDTIKPSRMGPVAETLTQNFSAGFRTMMTEQAANKPVVRKNVSFVDSPSQHFSPPEEEDEIEEESEPELEEEDDLDVELEEELRELQEIEDLNNNENNKKK